MSSSVKTRDSALNAIKRYMAKSVDDAFTMDAESIKSYMQLLSEQWTRFNSAQDTVEISCGSENVDIEESKCRAEAQPASVSTPVSAAIRLPKMELPKFSGDSTEWIGFFDAFSALVDCNAALSNGQKLHYLRSCLRGDALKIISGFKICDVNYEEAWDLLKSRYKVMRVIVEGHFRAMANVKRAASDTADAIKEVIDAFQQHIRELKALGRPVEFWDDWLVYELVNKLGFETRKQWELSLVTDEPPTFEQLATFLEVRCRSLSMLSSSTVLLPAKGKTASVCKPTNVFHAVQDQDSTGCTFCNGPLKIYSCENFRDLDANGKSKFVRESRVCMNCLSSGHYKAKCNSTSACRICHQRHHTLLHNAAATTNATTVAHFVNSASLRPFSPAADVMDQTNVTVSSANGPSTNTAAACTSSHLNANPNQLCPRERTVLLATALVKVRDCSGHWQPARLLFDSGSHASFVTESCVQRLGLPRRGSAILISGIGSSQGIRSKGEVLLSLSSHFSDLCFTVDALILPKITSDLPTQPLKVLAWPHIQDIFLADQHFMKPGRIDILVRMDVMGQLLCSEIRKGPPGTPMAQRTVFGWTLFGNVDGSESTSLGLQSLHCEVHLDRALTRLWELEEAPKKAHLTYEERYCEEFFEKTHRRSPDGRFIVELPLKSDVPLGASRSYAVRSLLSIEKRLARDDDLRQRYNEFMQELIDMKHMELAPPPTDQTFYMPHHPVIKESSVTTKLRVVFNASAKTTTGNSLNDALFNASLRSNRGHREMYRQICMSTKNLDLQRIVWRRDPTLPIKDYRMLRVTYGVAAASYLAVKSLQQTAKYSSHICEKAAAVIHKDFYMDDFLTGASSKEELLCLQRNVSEILKEGGFELRKWASNCAELFENVSNASENISHYLVDSKDVHALGLIWNTEEDYFTFSVNLNQPPTILTKRTFLSDASTLFDPLGLLAPATIRSKMWFQEIWLMSVGWDDVIPDCIAAQWRQHRSELLLLSSLKISRWFGTGAGESFTELHIFADDSERVYAAVMYARTLHNDGTITVVLISSKTKVAPLKTTTLPRLELCAAHLAAKLARSVLHSWGDLRYPIYASTDSTITLAWLQAHPRKVANKFQLGVRKAQLKIFRSANPADDANEFLSGMQLDDAGSAKNVGAHEQHPEVQLDDANTV
ncbi:uncharacterized protein LOC128870226 [Anastrepha ludens]|uniref:uncharacterized protein LOC128870226 n=1 Tax=Anastrepha ludens TaxID=28586 RepID=UPI0023B01BAB|nr:uncharacterized protein LOC128870226 [Anastrepha ludens]